MGGGNGAKKDLEDAGQSRSLTVRQKAVLELLRRGDSNKIIARQLGMREGTVKVHVRQIMRKFGVTNRTQVAVVCADAATALMFTAMQLSCELADASLPCQLPSLLSFMIM
jgi:DNA-binding NarL/FixJ family response regulator